MEYTDIFGILFFNDSRDIHDIQGIARDSDAFFVLYDWWHSVIQNVSVIREFEKFILCHYNITYIMNT